MNKRRRRLRDQALASAYADQIEAPRCMREEAIDRWDMKATIAGHLKRIAILKADLETAKQSLLASMELFMSIADSDEDRSVLVSLLYWDGTVDMKQLAAVAGSVAIVRKNIRPLTFTAKCTDCSTSFTGSFRSKSAYLGYQAGDRNRPLPCTGVCPKCEKVRARAKREESDGWYRRYLEEEKARSRRYAEIEAMEYPDYLLTFEWKSLRHDFLLRAG